MTVIAAITTIGPQKCWLPISVPVPAASSCYECGGDGNWGKFAPGMVPADTQCPDCKGSGWLLVSI
jgi:DnaJ-class molecular chaperone